MEEIDKQRKDKAKEDEVMEEYEGKLAQKMTPPWIRRTPIPMST